MYLTILILPLLGGLLGINRLCGNKWGPILSTLCIGLVTILSAIAFFEVGFGGAPVTLKLGNW